MEIKYHINPKTGRPNICKLETPESCLYYNAESNTPASHFDNKVEAFQYIETLKKKEYKNTPLQKHSMAEFRTLPNSNHSKETNYNELSIEEYERFLKLRQVDNFFTLDTKDFFLVMSQYNAQAKSKWIEQFLGYNLGITLVSSTLNRGDGVKDDKYYEFKTSTTNKGRNLNMRQIRLYQNNDYYICSYIDELNLKNSRTFKLTHEELKDELKIMNGVDESGNLKGFTHGTQKANKNNPIPEYSLTLPINDSNIDLKRWTKNYWYNQLYDVLTEE